MAKGIISVLKDKIDVKNLLDNLNAALAEEWLAFYQYWVGALVVKGPHRTAVQSELEEHAKEELNHADMIAKRIVQLDGTPVLDPSDWTKLATCKYEAPTDPCVSKILEQNIDSEKCAINRYQALINMTHGVDYITCEMAKAILAEEMTHEQDLQDFLDDINAMCCKKELVKS